MNPRDVWGVPNGWTRGEDLEFKWVGNIQTLEPARFANKSPSPLGQMVTGHELMVFKGPSAIEECNAFALWWFQSSSVRTIWSRPAFEYRPQTGELIEGEVIPARKSAKRLTVRKTSYED